MVCCGDGVLCCWWLCGVLWRFVVVVVCVVVVVVVVFVVAAAGGWELGVCDSHMIKDTECSMKQSETVDGEVGNQRAANGRPLSGQTSSPVCGCWEVGAGLLLVVLSETGA